MAFQIIRDDITKVAADAIVNTANPKPTFAAGTDAAIYKAAGADDLLSERNKIGNIAPGDARYTPAFALDAKYIIHTVGPAWEGGDHGEHETVRRCYENSLKLAEELGCESIAFPLIATGIYGFPKDEALQIAISVFSSFSMNSDMDITMVVFDKESFVLSGKVFSDVDAYIDENYVEETLDEEYAADEMLASSYSSAEMLRTKPKERGRRRKLFGTRKEASRSEMMGAASSDVFENRSMRSLEDLESQVEDTWQEMLFRLIDEKGLDPVEIYKNANINRKHFSKINSNKDYQPKKVTAVAFAISMHLNLDETKDFLSRAGYALSPSSKFDLIVRFFIEKENYNMFEINEVLFKHGLESIGLPKE
ncbi:MAG: macro domain-containing protein [Eubacterium sp.]|nr:macro domain-containing protein [Eubacterium sp.]